jgi:hypothetical protein
VQRGHGYQQTSSVRNSTFLLCNHTSSGMAKNYNPVPHRCLHDQRARNNTAAAYSRLGSEISIVVVGFQNVSNPNLSHIMFKARPLPMHFAPQIILHAPLQSISILLLSIIVSLPSACCSHMLAQVALFRKITTRWRASQL